MSAPLTDLEIRADRLMSVSGSDLRNIEMALEEMDALLDKPGAQALVDHPAYYRDVTAALSCIHVMIDSFRRAGGGNV